MKATTTSIIVAVILIGAAVVLSQSDFSPSDDVLVNNVSLVEGQQIIEIQAKGGYQPRKSIAKAGLPTILRFKTSGTFDCSSAVRIPSLSIRRTLALAGVTDIEIGNSQPGTLKGSCGMGMYPFEIDFQGWVLKLMV